MEMNERIHYDPNELIAQVENSLDALKVYQYDSRYRALLGEPLVQKLIQWENNIRRRKNDPFTLVVCGDFKRGKSSLINALLGEEVAPINATTETVSLNRISYGLHGNTAVLSGGRRMELRDEELTRSSLESLASQLKEPIRQLELLRPIELLKDITIIDTPGLGDAMQDFSGAVADALLQADAVIYVSSCVYPLSRSEQLYLKTSVLPQRYTSLFLVANFADIVDEEDLGRVQASIEERTAGMMPGQKIWMLSALDERCRQLGTKQPNPDTAEQLGRNFDSFRSSIQQLIHDKRDIVLPDRMQRMLGMMVADVSDDIYALEQGLTMSQQDVQASLEHLRQQTDQQAHALDTAKAELSAAVRAMQAETTNWICDLLTQMREDTAGLERFSTDDISKYYSFFCIDTIQEAMQRCTDFHIEQIYGILEKTSDELSRTMLRSSAKYTFRFVMDNNTWTKGDNVGLAGAMLGGPILSLVADGIGGVMRNKELKDRKPEIVKEIQRQYDSFMVSAQSCVTDTYAQLLRKAEQALEVFYKGKLEALQSQVEQSAMVVRQDETRKEEIRQALQQLRAMLQSISQAA